jgi:3-phytase
MNKTVSPILNAVLLACSLAAPASGAAPTVPATLNDAEELAALPGGGWLALGKRALRLVGADGRERASLQLRGERLDLRPLDGGALAIVIDANAERALPVRIDVKAGTLRALPVLPYTGFGIEAACLYRDAQQLDYVFLIAKDGQAQQWLLGSGGSGGSGTSNEHRLVRRLALPSGVEVCRVDDAHGTLFAAEEGMGLWAYGADAEGPPARAPVALQAPYGRLTGELTALAVLPGGVAAIDDKGALLTWKRDGKRWRAAGLPGQRRGLRLRPTSWPCARSKAGKPRRWPGRPAARRPNACRSCCLACRPNPSRSWATRPTIRRSGFTRPILQSRAFWALTRSRACWCMTCRAARRNCSQRAA